jgi:hypothetical protein
VGDFPSDAKVWKMDGLVRELREDIKNPLALLSVVAPETLEAYARKLVSYHQPAPVRQRESAMALRDAPMAASASAPGATTQEQGAICDGCNGEVTKAEAFFCRMNKLRFAGKMLCRKCQGLAPQGASKNASKVKAAAQCAECATEVDGKVVAFCRINSKKFNKRILCRTCQEKF